MRADARKHLNKSFCIITRALAFLSGSIHEYHHLADRSVESECLEILCNFLNSLMIYFLQSVICIFNDILRFSEEIPYFTDKSSRTFNALLLGENYARTMGLNVQRTRTLIFLSTVLLAGTVTAFCGPVGFIGLAVPHLARMLFASADHRILMPGSMLAGAALLLVCDLVAKSLALPINTITALMGIPVVIVVVVRNRNIF